MKRLCITDSEDRISEQSLSEASMTLYPQDSILMVTRSGILQHTFPVAITALPVTVNQDIKVIKPLPEISSRYMLYVLMAYGQTVLEKCSKAGTTVQSIDTAKLETMGLPLAPIAEQVRITRSLDSLLAQVNTLKARLDALPTLIKRFRQSALSDAVSGRLASDWQAVGESQASKKYQSVGSICIAAFDGPFGSKLKSDDYTASGTRVVRLENIGHLEFISSKETYIGNVKFSELVKNKLEEGDILFSSFVDEEVRVCRLPKSPQQFINKADCFCLRVDSSSAHPSFVMYSLASKQTYHRIRDAVHGATRPRINLGFLKDLDINLPPLEEQAHIVHRIEKLFAFADQLEARLADARQRVDALTQSILAKAFRGELVPQDPNDEPASVLLERIAAQRAADPKPKRGRAAKATS